MTVKNQNNMLSRPNTLSARSLVPKAGANATNGEELERPATSGSIKQQLQEPYLYSRVKTSKLFKSHSLHDVSCNNASFSDRRTSLAPFSTSLDTTPNDYKASGGGKPPLSTKLNS